MHFLVYTLCFVAVLKFGKALPMLQSDVIMDKGENTIEVDGTGQMTPKMFLIPKLEVGYKIRVIGKMKPNSEKLVVSLATGVQENPDYKNIVCQFKADFIELKTTTNIVKNGKNIPKDEELPPTDLFTDTMFSLGFEIMSKDEIAVHFGESISQHGCQLQHKIEDIRFLTLEDIEKVEQINFLLV